MYRKGLQVSSKTRTSASTFSEKARTTVLADGVSARPFCLSLLALTLLVSCSGRHITIPERSLEQREVIHETKLNNKSETRYTKPPVSQETVPAARSPEPPVIQGTSEAQRPPVQSSAEKKQIIASWYGPDFHGKLTASGEVYNMNDYTCAHKELPFGTKLNVLNTRSNKEVECLVNDRGPFIAGRDLDLSYAAAKKIDMIGTGTAPVVIEPVGRDMRYVKYIRESGPADGILTIQVASFKDASNARRLKTALEMTHSNVYIMEANVGGSRYFRVRMGKFSSRGDAYKAGSPLANEGYEVLITRYEQGI